MTDARTIPTDADIDAALDPGREAHEYRAAASADFEAALANARRGAETCWAELLYGIEKAIADPADHDRRAALWQTLAQAQADALAADDRVTRIRGALDRAYRLRAQAARMEADGKPAE